MYIYIYVCPLTETVANGKRIQSIVTNLHGSCGTARMCAGGLCKTNGFVENKKYISIRSREFIYIIGFFFILFFYAWRNNGRLLLLLLFRIINIPAKGPSVNNFPERFRDFAYIYMYILFVEPKNREFMSTPAGPVSGNRILFRNYNWTVKSFCFVIFRKCFKYFIFFIVKFLL